MSDKFKVVISGVSGRFPECNDVSTFKKKLYNRDNFITVDGRKWTVGHKNKLLGEKTVPDPVGKFTNPYKYDHTVFKMNKTFAVSNDILNRVVLEPSFEAIVDAGINPYSLDGNNVAVFMSTGVNESTYNMCTKRTNHVLVLLGSNKSMLSNRVSYALNLKGASYSINIDPHGGLETLSMAYKWVSEGFAEAAIVGAPSSVMDPRISVHYFNLGILNSQDDTTRPFDEWANGYIRSDGVVCFYIQRAEDAKRNYGEIKFCDFNFSGSILSNFIRHSENYLEKTSRDILDANHFNPEESKVGFMEMNAFGYKYTDEIESNVIADMWSKNPESPLLVGSIKSNIGHTEVAATLMSVLKAMYALDSGILAPNNSLHKLNENIRAFKENRLQVVTETTPLPGTTIAVNSVGLLGTVGLMVLQQNEKSANNNCQSGEFVPRILLICGREENDLREKLAQIEKMPYNKNFVALANDVFGQDMPPHIYRGFTILPSTAESVHDLQEKGAPNRPVWFIFSGMGSQWNGMGKRLLDLPIFAETVAKCDKVLREKNIDIYHILTSDDPELFDDILNAFVGIITIQIGLYEVIKALGIVADGIIGHSVGENGCAYADGCLSLEQAVLASWARGVASTEVKTIKGMMAAVGKGCSEIEDTLPEDIQVACHNAADSCTLSGPAESVNALVQKLQNEGVFAKTVNVANIAYHSKFIAPAGPKLLQRLKEVIREPKQRSSRWVSTSVPESGWNSPSAQLCSAEYLTNNLLSPVLFEEGCKHIPANAICIEFAPHGLLQAILKRSLPDTCTNIPLTNRSKKQDNLSFLLSAIGKLYIAGQEPRVNDIFPSIEYPVPRETPSLSPFCSWYHAEDTISPEIFGNCEEDAPISCESVAICIRDDSEYSYLKDHVVNGSITIPPSFFLYLVWKLLASKRRQSLDSSTVIFEDVKINYSITMSEQDVKYMSVMIQYGSGNFEVTIKDVEEGEDFRIIMTGCINFESRRVKSASPSLLKHEINENTNQRISNEQFYDIFARAGYELGKEFRSVDELNLEHRNTEYKTEIAWNENWVTFLDALIKIQMFADTKQNVDGIVLTRVGRLEILASQFSSLKKGHYIFIAFLPPASKNGIGKIWSKMKSLCLTLAGAAIPCTADAITKESICSSGMLVMRALKYKSLFERRNHSNSVCHRFIDQPTMNKVAQKQLENENLTNYNTDHARAHNIKSSHAKDKNHIRTQLLSNISEPDEGTLSANGFAYATSVSGTERKIGFATTSSTGCVEYDPHLFWITTKKWNVEDMVTALYIYAQAYNILTPMSKHQKIKSFMVNVGAEILLAEALITLAFYRSHAVYVVVDSADKAIYFLSKFPQLKSENIFCDEDYEVQLKQRTKGKKFDLVVNFVPGILHVDACFRCVEQLGFFIEVGNSKNLESLDIGLFEFLRSVTFHVKQNNVSDLLGLRVDAKIKMKNYLEECIRKGMVVPPKTGQPKLNVPLIFPTASPMQFKPVARIENGGKLETLSVSKLPHNSEYRTRNKGATKNLNLTTKKEDEDLSLRDYLPYDLEILSTIGQEKIDEPTFVETASLSRRYSHCKGIYPVFALPAVHGVTLQPLFQRLFYPVFSAVRPAPDDSMKETARKLYESLTRIQPSGPITIISETWTVPLALELVSHARLVNRKYRILALEGNPKTWSEQARRLRTLAAKRENKIYADDILHDKMNEMCSDGFLSFEDEMTAYVRDISNDVKQVENASRVASKIRDRVSELARIQFTDELLKHITWFERYRPDDRAFNLSATSEIIVLNEPNYNRLLANEKMSKIINEKTEFSWWEYPIPQEM